MAGITFSEVEIKKLILALAGSKAPMEDEAQESPEHEAKPEDKSEDKAEGESEDSSGKPFDTKAMLEKKLKGKDA